MNRSSDQAVYNVEMSAELPCSRSKLLRLLAMSEGVSCICFLILKYYIIDFLASSVISKLFHAVHRVKACGASRLIGLNEGLTAFEANSAESNTLESPPLVPLAELLLTV